MRRLAAFAISGYSQAILCVIGFAILGLFILPIGTVFSAAVLALTGLKFGLQRSVLVLCAALAGFALILIIMSATDMQIKLGSEILITVIYWVLMLVLSQVLRNTQSLSYTLQCLVVLSIFLILTSFWLVPDRNALWNGLSVWMLQVAMSVLCITSLLLARWWQSLLIEDLSFVDEFTRFKLGKIMAAGSLLFLVFNASTATVFDRSSVEVGIIAILLAMFFLQGIATVHFLLRRIANGRIFIFIFYGALILSVKMPLLPGLIAVLGILENFINLRQRMAVSN